MEVAEKTRRPNLRVLQQAEIGARREPGGGFQKKRVPKRLHSRDQEFANDGRLAGNWARKWKS